MVTISVSDIRERLARVDLAIEKIESGAQEYRVGSRVVRRGDLAALYSERRRLEKDLKRAEITESGGGVYVAVYKK